jgi:hypothetical protein
MAGEQFEVRHLRFSTCAHGCLKIVEKCSFFDAKKPNARIHSVIDVYALFAISYTHLPPNCAKIPYNNHMLRSAFLAMPVERTMPLVLRRTGHDFVRVLAGELHANSVRPGRRRSWHEPLRALGGKFPGAIGSGLADAYTVTMAMAS